MLRYVSTACILLLFALNSHADQWEELFNGKDLSGWRPVGGPANNWSVEGGVLSCNGKPGAQWLATDAEYGDFELSLQFNVPADGNSGVFIRAPKDGVPWVEGLEIQILDDYGTKWKGLKPAQFTGSVYAVIAPSKRATEKAGSWQTMLVRCVGSKIQVTINKQLVVDANLDDYGENAKSVPGLKRTQGHIGLQNHGDKISFRNLRVRKLPAGAKKQP